MNRIVLTVLSLLLIVGGLILFALGIRGFLAALPAEVMISPQEVGLYAPPTLWIGVLTEAAGLILFTFRKHF